jgi:CelD/BcsL family acetyltransferase involved in cellulose biosynthesis
MEIVRYTRLSDLADLREVWARLSEQEAQFVPNFADFEFDIARSGAKFCVFATVENGQVISLACFIYHDGIKRYGFAGRRLLALPVKRVYLFGSCVLGQASEELTREFFQQIIAEGGFDVIEVGQILVDSILHRAIAGLPRSIIVWQAFRKNELRWLIRLPGSFEEYLASLGAESRRHANRYSRRVEQEGAEYRLISGADEVEDFLRAAETISRTTYQWKLDRGVRNDERSRQWLRRIAERGNLRCYLLYLHGKPCAFGWGQLCHRTFYYQAIGYDPQFAKLSPGTALFMRLMRDLIENTDCASFDFGSGREDGYKSRLATISLDCVSLEVAPRYRPYSFTLAALDRVLVWVKNLIMNSMERLAGRGALRRRLKSALRPLGVAMY